MNISKSILLTLAAVSVLGLSACTESATDEANENGDEPAQTAISVPATLFATTAPGDARPLFEAKSAAKQGDRVVFEARVGGRKAPFVENRAVFFVTDPSILSCDQLHGDTCATPWDYCCEAQDNLLANMATVQVVDDSGQPLKASLEEEHGLEPLKTVIIVGTVNQMDDAGTFVVNAESIHVKEG